MVKCDILGNYTSNYYLGSGLIWSKGKGNSQTILKSVI